MAFSLSAQRKAEMLTSEALKGRSVLKVKPEGRSVLTSGSRRQRAEMLK
jgi:hypothetical protein